MTTIQRVLIVGGTHGNELIGVHMVEKIERDPSLVQRPSLEVSTLLANPEATLAGRRYVDQDLNRSFAALGGTENEAASYELARAREIRDTFGPGGPRAADFIIDQHGTTANVGLMLIIDNLDAFTLRLAAHLSQLDPRVRLYSSAHSGRQRDAVRSLAPHQIGIEVGPIAHSTLHAELFQKNEALILAVLDYLEAKNQGHELPGPNSVTLYQYVGAVDYPRAADGGLRGMIHPKLQFRDYEPMSPGDPMFLTFEGETICYEGAKTVYPVFINEAAYYEKGIALCLTDKRQLEVPTA